MPVSARFLLEGFWYSVEQCGRLLHSAVTAYDAGDHSTGAGLALLAREELGKGRILLEMWEQQQTGKVIEIADVKAALEDHEDKQAAAQLSNTLTTSHGTYAGKLMQRMMADPTSEDGKAATAELDALMAKKAKRTPSDRHEARQRSFYVDPDPGGTGWRRPSAMGIDEARQHVFGLANDYSLLRARLTNPSGSLREALEEWPERPPLPERIWPNS